MGGPIQQSDNPFITHEQFLQMDRDPSTVWGVRSLYRSAYLVWGIGPVLALMLISAIILTPSLGFLGYCLWHERYAACLWGFLGVMAFRSARDVSCTYGCLPVVEIPVAIVISLVTWSPLHVVGALLALPTYFAAGFVKSITVFGMGDVLRTSPEVFATMQDARQIVYVRSDNRNIQVTPESGPTIEV